MMLVIMVDVITRKFGLLTIAKDFFLATEMHGAHNIVNKYITSTKMQELEWHLHAALFLLCMGFGYVKNSHVRIEIVREKFDVYTKSWLEVIGIVIFIIPYTYLLFRYGLNFTERSFHLNEVSAALTGLSHRWIIKAAIPSGFALLALQGVADTIRGLVAICRVD